MGTVVKAGLPHSRESFLLVDLGCGCEVVHLDRALIKARYEGIPLVFAINGAHDLPPRTERIDPESLRAALNPWFTPRVYAFTAGHRVAYVQPTADPRRSITDPLKEARRALETR